MEQNTLQRTWTLAHPDPEPTAGPPEISQRGACLMLIEFLVRYPCSECIWTSRAFPFSNKIMEMFPDTLFHIFCATLETPPQPNVIRHPVVFDKDTATSWRQRGSGAFNVIFTGESMDNQMALHISAAPSTSLMMITAAPEYYLAGDLLCPLYTSPESCISMLVPSTENRAERYGARAYLDGLKRFHNTCRAGSTDSSPYDWNSETTILTAYAQKTVTNPLTVKLLVEVVRSGLPSMQEAPLRFSVGF
jgi:hypothetical protein